MTTSLQQLEHSRNEAVVRSTERGARHNVTHVLNNVHSARTERLAAAHKLHSEKGLT